MDANQVTGIIATVTWSYYTAAGIHGYVVSRDKVTKRWMVVARVVTADAFKMSQRPLLFVAPFTGGEWRWPILTSTLVDGRLVANLGPPETVTTTPRKGA